MLKDRLQGLFCVAVTPFDARGAFDKEACETLLRWHMAQGARGLVVAADNGEASSLNLAERRALVKTAVRVAAGRIPVVMGAIGAHAYSATETAQMVAVGAEAGADAALVAPSSYNRGGARSEIVRRFQEIYAAAPLPLIAYNSPNHFGAPLQGDTLQAIYDTVELVGVKQSSRDFLDVSMEIDRFGDRLAMFMGCGWLIMPGLAMGAAGIMSTGADLLGPESARVVERARGPASAEARRLHLRIGQLYAFLLSVGTSPAALKAALKLIGLPAGDPRLPGAPLEATDVARLRALLIKLDVPIADAASEVMPPHKATS